MHSDGRKRTLLLLLLLLLWGLGIHGGVRGR
jgi:hypothetical protein